MKTYRVKVTEIHSDYVEVEAEDEEEAKKKAIDESDCQFEFIYDCEIIEG